MRTRALQVLTGVILGAATAAAIVLVTTPGPGSDAVDGSGSLGDATLLPAPYPAPTGSLTGADGSLAPVVDPGAGIVTAVFFGYTHCPDVCPATMASAARALELLPHDDAARVRVSLVTVDPLRDTPARLESWLSSFRGSFPGSVRGFTGSEEEIREVAMAWGAYVGTAPPAADGAYTVDHSARSWIAADGRVLASVSPGASPEAWARTLEAALVVAG